MRHHKLDAPYRLDRKASWTDPEMIRFIGLQQVGRVAKTHRDAGRCYRLDRKASWTDPEMIRFIGLQQVGRWAVRHRKLDAP